MRIIQIVPQFPPAVNGLGDYAYLLAQALRGGHEISSKIVVGDPNWTASSSLSDFRIGAVTARTSSALLEALETKPEIQTVLLHYVGYGYAKRGCPFWLISGVKKWKARQPGRRLVTIFHELFAKSSLPWTSSFWNSPFQRYLARRLAEVTDHCHTTMRMFAEILRSYSLEQAKQITTLPVLSTIGESRECTSLKERKTQMVVFGGTALRRKIYALHEESLIRACKALRAEVILDIGPPTGIKLDLPVPVIEMGYQLADSVRSLLAESQAGFLSYFNGALAKSSVFAAYCAHGLVPVLPIQNAAELDEIRAGSEYMIAADTRGDVPEIEAQRVADTAHAWYEKHSIGQTAAILAVALNQSQTAE